MFIQGEYNTAFTSEYKGFPADYPWTAPVAKKIAAYELLWEKWSDMQIKLDEALVDVAQASGKDERLLVEAVAASKPHPGKPTADAAADALAYAKEATKQAASAATNAGNAIVSDLRKDKHAILAVAIKAENEQINASIKAYDDAQLAVQRAEAEVRRIGESINWFINELGEGQERQLAIFGRAQTINFPDYNDFINQADARFKLDLLTELNTRKADQPVINVSNADDSDAIHA